MDFIKAPWRYEKQSGEIYGGKSNVLICDMLPTGDEVHEANAALIAAAPEMYEMLSSIKQCLEWGYTNVELVDNISEYADKLTQLLAKARGEK